MLNYLITHLQTLLDHYDAWNPRSIYDNDSVESRSFNVTQDWELISILPNPYSLSLLLVSTIKVTVQISTL